MRAKPGLCRSPDVRAAWLLLLGLGLALHAGAGCAKKADEDTEHAPAPQAATVLPTAPPSGLPSAVGARRAELLACLPEGQRERPGGTWIVQARLTGTGQMREVTVGTADPVPPAVVACLIEVLERVQIPGHQGPPRTVSFPLWVDAP